MLSGGPGFVPVPQTPEPEPPCTLSPQNDEEQDELLPRTPEQLFFEQQHVPESWPLNLTVPLEPPVSKEADQWLNDMSHTTSVFGTCLPTSLQAALQINVQLQATGSDCLSSGLATGDWPTLLPGGHGACCLIQIFCQCLLVVVVYCHVITRISEWLFLSRQT